MKNGILMSLVNVVWVGLICDWIRMCVMFVWLMSYMLIISMWLIGVECVVRLVLIYSVRNGVSVKIVMMLIGVNMLFRNLSDWCVSVFV